MNRCPRRWAGFTIVEMLVVVSIIGLLVAILVPALSGVQRRARKANELNNLRQVGFAWNGYAASNNDAAIPGYMSIPVQATWRSTYELPNGALLPPAPSYSGADNIAGPWTWRLLPYMGYNLELIRDYLDDDEATSITSIFDEESNLLNEKALAVAEEPAFGYNGYYVGGYWRMYRIAYSDRPRFQFFDVNELDDPDQPVNPVATSLGSIRRSEEMIVFCSAARRSRGIYRRREAANAIGSDLVTPPFLADLPQWQQPGWDGGPGMGGGPAPTRSGGVYDLEVVSNNARAPLGRYNGMPALYYADGHVGTQTYGGIFDMRMWINDGDERFFFHGDTTFPLAE